MCKVVPIYAGHILLGRSWQYDRKVVHDWYKNGYNFIKDEKYVTHIPSTSKHVYDDQLKLRGEDEKKNKEIQEENDIDTSKKRENGEVIENKEKRVEPHERKEKSKVSLFAKESEIKRI